MFENRRDEYVDIYYAQMQVRDSVRGSSAVKRKNELYLPMPSGMMNAQNSASSSNQQHRDTEASKNMISIQNMPWYHANPAYRSYLQRTRFPDIVSPILRGIIGIATKTDAEFKLPSSLKHMDKFATICNKSLIEMYAYTINEVMQSGKMCFVVSFAKENGIKIALYGAERHIDWEHDVIDGEKVLTKSVFVEEFQTNDKEEITIEYSLANGIAYTQRYEAGNKIGDEIVLMHMGKPLDRLPVFFATATDNHPEIEIVPLLGVSDIAMTIYRKDADLAQSQYNTCNPTLFMFGITETEKPAIIGSTVAVAVSNPEASAMYPKTDTSGLDHVREVIEDLKREAATSGAQFLNSGGKGAESAEALSIREASSGATLVSIVKLISKAISNTLSFAAGLTAGESVEFKGAIDFANHNLSAQELTVLVTSWMSNVISHDTLLNNMRDANIIDKDITNEAEKAKILVEREEEFAVAEKLNPIIDEDDDDGDDKDKDGGKKTIPDKDNNNDNKQKANK